jgi:hypothetical protein
MCKEDVCGQRDTSRLPQPRLRAVIRNGQTGRHYSSVKLDLVIEDFATGREVPIDIKYKLYADKKFSPAISISFSVRIRAWNQPVRATGGTDLPEHVGDERSTPFSQTLHRPHRDENHRRRCRRARCPRRQRRA